MSKEEKPWWHKGILKDARDFQIKMLKRDSHLLTEEFRKQYLVDFESFKKQVEGCETKAVRGDERCPEDGIERLIDDQTVYLCDKCYESYMQRITDGEYKKTMIYINNFKH